MVVKIQHYGMSGLTPAINNGTDLAPYGNELFFEPPIRKIQKFQVLVKKLDL